MTLSIRIRDRCAMLVSTDEIVCGNSDYSISFDFDSEWDGLDKTAQIVYHDKRGEVHRINVEISGNTCAVPVLHDVDEITVGVFGGDIRTSTGVRIPCARCITDGNQESAVPEFDFYNTMLEAWACRQNGDMDGWAACMQALHDHFDASYGAGG